MSENKHDYLKWDKIKIEDFSDKNIEEKYDNGYVFTRIDQGVMDQTRSLRINLDKFNLSSENRRVLRKTEEVEIKNEPLPYSNYSWQIHKLGKDFYDKFEEGLFSANKVKELMTKAEKSNFNTVFIYSKSDDDLGYCISRETENIIHYSYPFYNRKKSPKNMGMGMMIRAIKYAKDNHKKYIYLGSGQRPSDTYKLQFEGLEWFDGDSWNQNLDKLKNVLENI